MEEWILNLWHDFPTQTLSLSLSLSPSLCLSPSPSLSLLPTYQPTFYLGFIYRKLSLSLSLYSLSDLISPFPSRLSSIHASWEFEFIIIFIDPSGQDIFFCFFIFLGPVPASLDTFLITRAFLSPPPATPHYYFLHPLSPSLPPSLSLSLSLSRIYFWQWALISDGEKLPSYPRRSGP